MIKASCLIDKFIKLFHQKYILITSSESTIGWCPSVALRDKYETYRVHHSEHTIKEIGKQLLYLKSTGIKIFVVLLPLDLTLTVIHAGHVMGVSGDDYLWMLPNFATSVFSLDYEPINLFYLNLRVERFCQK